MMLLALFSLALVTSAANAQISTTSPLFSTPSNLISASIDATWKASAVIEQSTHIGSFIGCCFAEEIDPGSCKASPHCVGAYATTTYGSVEVPKEKMTSSRDGEMETETETSARTPNSNRVLTATSTTTVYQSSIARASGNSEPASVEKPTSTAIVISTSTMSESQKSTTSSEAASSSRDEPTSTSSHDPKSTLSNNQANSTALPSFAAKSKQANPLILMISRALGILWGLGVLFL